jgi:hypothetical protein
MGFVLHPYHTHTMRLSYKGPIARVAPNVLVTSSPEVWSRINAVRSPYTRSAWYYRAARFQPGKDHIFSEINDKNHDKRRKQMAAGVHVDPHIRVEELTSNTKRSTLARRISTSSLPSMFKYLSSSI